MKCKPLSSALPAAFLRDLSHASGQQKKCQRHVTQLASDGVWEDGACVYCLSVCIAHILNIMNWPIAANSEPKPVTQFVGMGGEVSREECVATGASPSPHGTPQLRKKQKKRGRHLGLYSFCFMYMCSLVAFLFCLSKCLCRLVACLLCVYVIGKGRDFGLRGCRHLYLCEVQYKHGPRIQQWPKNSNKRLPPSR